MTDRRNFLKKFSIGFLGLNTIPTFAGLANKAESNFFQLAEKLDNSGDEDTYYKIIRQQLLLDPELNYLNTGSLGPSPRMVTDIVTSSMHKLEENPVGNNWGPLGEKMEAVREKAAVFFHAAKDEIILTRNTTEGMNLIGSGYKLQKGDEILTTNHEHPGGLVCWEHKAKHEGIKIIKFNMPLAVNNKDQILELLEKHITPKTRVVSLSHVNTITGLRMPFKEISEITRPKNILLVCDGAQAPGMLDINIEEMGVDVYATSGHKWMLGPKETGILFIRKDVRDQIDPVFLYSGNQSYSASSGTRNVATIIGLGFIMDFLQLIGMEKIENRCLELRNNLYSKLKPIAGLKIISPENPELSSGIVSVDLINGNKADVANSLKENNIIVKQLPQYNALRFSTHVFNTKEETDQLVEYLPKFL